jgi:GMP synthase (glutamine-hydrolysing)
VRPLCADADVPATIGPDEILVSMGGPMGVGDIDSSQYPFLRRAVELLKRCVVLEAPVLGVCLGAQLLAHAAGALVYPMRGPRRYEVGLDSVVFHDVGPDILDGLPAEAPMLHWHRDTFSLPRGAKLLASTRAARTRRFD